MLQRLHDEAPMGRVTLGWLTSSLRKRSFGIIVPLPALVAIAPGASIVAGGALRIPAVQMIADQAAPILPTPPRRPSLTDAAPRRTSAASRVSAKLGFPSSIRSTPTKAIGGLILAPHCRPIRPFKWRTITHLTLFSWYSEGVSSGGKVANGRGGRARVSED